MLLDINALSEKEQLTFEETADAMEYLYKLTYHPVAVKFFWDQAEYDNFKAEKIPGPKMTVCQIALASRMNDCIVKATDDNLMCGNARTCFGFREPSDPEVDDHVKYTVDWDMAKECLWAKPRLPKGLKGFATAPLGRANFEPDVIFLVVNPLQAYHILNDYIGGKKVPNLTFNHTINSAVCGGMAYCYNEQKPNMNTMCAGSYTSGKTETGEVNVFIPGKDIGDLIKQLIRRTAKYGGSSMVGSPGQEFPGLHVCKQCPMVRFKDAE
ncbi:MAG: DUF169 domain-containing protein [Bacillota bacterium]